VAVVLLRHLSNFTDFYSLERDERIHLFYTNNVDELAKADVIIVPGSKSTIDDIRELRANGVAQAILRAYRDGATVLGICGGYQIMGQEVLDPNGVEGDIHCIPGLGLLPVRTVLTVEKVTRQVEFKFRDDASVCRGYEIHMGKTTAQDVDSPLNTLSDGTADGYFVNERCFGSYVHGLLDNPNIVNFIIGRFDKSKAATDFDYSAYKQQQYDLLADHVRANLDMAKLYKILQSDD
jgi:adenosylcobyric acid synthase